MSRRALGFSLPVALLLTALASAQARPTPTRLSKSDQWRVDAMLVNLRQAIHQHYYDPHFHGVNLDARYEKYKQQLDAAPNVTSALRVLAAYVAGLHDSHTFFLPPPLTEDFFYGLRMGIIGDQCYILGSRPGTDADGKVHPGDLILRLNGYTVSRKDYSDLSYYLYGLEPQGGLRLQLQAPDGTVRTALVKTKFVPRPNVEVIWNGEWGVEEADQINRMSTQRWAEAGNVGIWNVPFFGDDMSETSHAYNQIHDHPGLVMDLRDDPGGDVEMLQYMLGYFLKEKTTIGRRVGRDDHGPLEVKPHGDPYPGKLVVLINDGSASAAEIFARVIQLHHLGTIVGDRSAGAVMEAQHYSFTYGTNPVTPYGISVTAADLVMEDGQSLENRGVTPDVEAIPTAADLAAGRDPVLALAVKLAGGSLDPAAAGKLFPYRWPPFRLQH